MATSKHVWNPAHHPRDARGRFTKSATRVLKASDAKRAKAAVAGFKPTDLGPAAANGAEWIKRQAAATAAADDAVARYFAGGWKTTHQELRTKKDAATDPDVIAIDKAMQPLSDDVMLERRVSLKMFAHIPLEQLQGMKVRDAAYQPTALQGSQGEAPDGMVTIHMAVPAGTRAIVNPDTGAIVLDRDTETAISRVEPNGRGGYDLYGIVIPKTGSTKPGRPAGEPAQGDAPNAEAPNSAPEAPNAGATPDQGDQDTAGGSAAAGGDNTRRRRPATPPRNATGDDAGDQSDAGADGAGGDSDQDAGDGTTQRPRKAAASTAGTRAPSDGDDSTSRAGEDDDVQGAAAADSSVEIAVADIDDRTYVHIAGVDEFGSPISATGYAGRPGPVTIRKRGSKKPGRPMLAVSMSETPTGGGGWRTMVYTDPEATAEIRPEPEQWARPPAAAPDDVPAGSRLAELSPTDRVMLANRVADEGPGIFQSPMTRGNFGDVARYVTEAEGSRPLVEKYGTPTVWAATEEYARANPAVLARTVDEVRALRADRAERASAHATAAAAATKARDYDTARAEIDAGEMVDPTHRENFRGWDEMRAIVARVEQKNTAAGLPADTDVSTAGTSTPDPTRATLADHGTPTRAVWHGAARAPRNAGVPVRIDVQDDGSFRVLSADGKINQRHPAVSKVWLAPATGDQGADIPEAPTAAGRTVADLQRNDYVTVAGTSTQDRRGARTATGYVAATTPTGGDTMVTLTEYPNGAGARTLVLAPPDAEATPATRPADTDVVLWKDAKTGRPVANPGQTAIVRHSVVRDPDREATVRDALTALDTETPAPDAGGEVSPLGEDLDVPPPGADRLDPAVSQPTRNRWEDHGSPTRVIWFGDGTRPKGRGEFATLAQRGTGRNATLLVRGVDDESDLLRRQNITDRMWLAPVDAPRVPAGGAARVNPFDRDRILDGPDDTPTAGTSTPDADPDETAGARIGDRIGQPVDELLANPTIGPSSYSGAAEARTWPAELSVPDVAQTIDVDGRKVAIVRYRTLTMPTAADTPTLGWTDQFYAVPADARFRPLRMSHLTREHYGQPAGSAAAGVPTATAVPVGEYRNMHLASGKTANAAASGARAKIEKEAAREKYAPAARANIGVHDKADFDRLDPNAQINPGDLVVLRVFNKLRTGVATKVTANKVDALVSTPTGAADNWYGTAQKGVGVRLLRRADADPAPASVPAPDAPAAGTSAPTAEPAPTLDPAEERAAVAGRVFAMGQLDDVTRDDTRFRMRRARVGNRELDVYDEQGTRLGILHQEPGRDGWLTLPAHGRAGVTAPTFAAAVASLRAGEVSPEATPALPSPAAPPAPVVDPEQRREQIADSMAGAQAKEIADAVDDAIDKAEPADPVDARTAALAAKEAELAKANAAFSAYDYQPYGNQKTKSSARRTDAAIRRTAEMVRDIQRIEREVAALRRPPAPTAPKGGFTPEQLEGATHIRTRYGWYKVAKVNKKSVKVDADPGWDDLIPIKRIIEVRGAPAPDTAGDNIEPKATPDASTAGTGTPAPDAPAAGAGNPDAVSIARQADPFALVGDDGAADLDAAFGPTTPPAPATPAVDVASIAVDDEVRVAGQWATVTAKTDGQIRVRFPDDRMTLVNPADIRQHRPVVRVEDMFGGITTFAPQDRATIGLATRADVGRTRGQQDVQQVSMFDVSDQVQIEGQEALLDMFFQAPTAEPPVSVPLLPADAPEPTRVNVPDDLTGWTDEQLAGLFSEVVAQAEYDEDGTLRITAEWDRREQEMNALLGMVPEDLTTLDDNSAAALFADLTAHHGTMDSDVVARLEADLDRRDAEHQAGLADLEAKRALLARDPRTYADDVELKAALDAAGELDDESALDRVLAEYERRDEQERAEAARVAMEAQAAAVAEQAAAAETAAAESRRIAAEAAAVEHSKTLSGLLAARGAGYYGGVSAGDAETAAQHVDPAELARILDGTEIRDASLEQKVRILYAAGRADAAEEFAGWSTDKLFGELTKKTLGRGGPGFDRERADRAGREWSRRKLAERLQGDETSLQRFAYELLRRDDVAGLTDAQLAAAPALMAVYDGPFADEIPSRMRVLDDEIKRRMDVADAKTRKAEAGPAGPARVVDPVGEMHEIERWVDSNTLSSYGYRGTDARDRWEKARKIVLGLPESTDRAEANRAWRADARPLPERAATLLAWYRHLGELDDVDASDSMVRKWMVGPADDPDLPDVPDTLPPANVAKPADVWSAIRAQAREDAEAGDFRAAIRLAMAQNRAYGVRIAKPDGTDMQAWQSVNGRHYNASAGDRRTDGQKAALFIAELRRLAEEDGVDPDDALRYGPHDKGTVRKVKIGRVTVTTNPATEARVSAMLAQGHDLASAYALVYGIDESEVRRAEADAAIRSSGKTLAQAYREQYDSMVASAYAAAETGTRGHLLNDEGKKLWLEGKLSAIELFSGPSSKAYRYASEELQRWWGEHPPPRMTFAEFKQMAQGDARTALASATQNAKGSEFA